MIIIGYIILYHKQKKQVLAVLFAATASVLLLSSAWFLMPFSSRASIADIKTSKMTIDDSGPNNYAMCEDGTKYRINSTNTMLTSGFDSYENNKQYSNEKVTISYQYNYKLWWIIPAQSTSETIAIYIDGKDFYELYGCSLGEAVIIKE